MLRILLGFGPDLERAGTVPGAPPPLRGTETVKTAWVIGALRIVEIGGARRQRDGLHRLPIAAGEICAGFHHYNDIAGAGDVEPECSAVHAKTSVTHLGLRIPKYGGLSGKIGAPTGGTRQVINRRWRWWFIGRAKI